MIKDYFKLAFRNLKKRKLRTFLTLLGIFISVATIFLLVSLSLGLQDAVKEQFRQLGTDKFFIQPGTGFLGPPGSVGGAVLTNNDLTAVKKVQGVKDAYGSTFANGKIEFNKIIRYNSVTGMETKTNLYIETGTYKIEDGKFLKEGSQGVLLGNAYKTKNLFGKPIRVGDKILINNKEVKVLGIMQSTGNSDDDSLIIMDMGLFRTFFNIPDRVDWIVVQTNSGGNLTEISNNVEIKLRKFRGLTEKTQDFEVLTPEELLGSFKSILNIITIFLAGIAGISLFVGAVGIANTMYTSVLERTNEIGIMKAVGAQNKDILSIFLIESGLLGLAGALIGVILGLGIGKFVEYVAINNLGTNLLQAASPAYLIFGCLAFGFLIGAVSGVLPALRASKIRVVEALRYE